MRHAALDWIGMLLARDSKTSKYDDLNETWAKSFPPLPFEGGQIAIVIEDAQGRFNINSLLKDGQADQQTTGMFRAILELIGLDPALVEGVLDWLDIDDDTRPGGAEDTEYVNSETPYRTGKQLFTSVDELRLVRGFDAETVSKLRPYIVALPQNGLTMNVNTAPDVVLAAMFNNMTIDQAKVIIQERTRRPFTKSQDVDRLLPDGVTSRGVGFGFVTSNFLIRATITYGRWNRTTLALIERLPGGKTSRVLWHHPLYPALPKVDDAAENQKDDENDN
jgi:general secretion pathway protein K